MSLTAFKTKNNGVSSPYGRGVATIIEGNFPVSTGQVVQGVGNLSQNDLVEIVQLQPQTGCVGFVYDRTGSTFAANGTGAVSIVPLQGGNSPAAAVLLQVRVFRNT